MSTYHSIQDYLTAKEKYDQTPLYCRKGRMYEIVDGKEVEVFHLDKPHFEYKPKFNNDGTAIPHGCVPAKQN